MNIKRLLAVGLLAASLAGCTTPQEAVKESIETAIEQQKSNAEYLVVVEPPKIKKDTFSDYIVGSFVNTASETIDYAEVHIAVYDKEGAQLTTAITNIADLLPGKTWKYEIPLFTEDTATVEIVEVTVDIWK